MQNPNLYYQELKSQSSLALQHSEARERQIGIFRLIVALASIAAIYLGFTQDGWYYWIPTLACAGIFATLMKAALRQEIVTKMARSRNAIATAELCSLDGDLSRFHNGSEHLDVSHPFSYDLDIFGKGSVFNLLCRTVTLEGTALLAERLKRPDIDPAAILQRQEAIRELSGKPGFTTEFRVIGDGTREEEGELEQLREWLGSKDRFSNNVLIRMASIVMPLLATAGLALSIWEERMHPALNMVIALNGLLWASQLKFIKQQNRLLGRNAAVVAKYSGLLAQVANENMQSETLRAISENARRSLQQLAQFNKLVSRFDSRNNGMAGPIMNVLFLHDIRSLLKLENWRRQHHVLAVSALSDLAGIDLLNALGSYAFNHQQANYPTFNERGKTIEATNLRHPLLPANAAVGNGFSIGHNEQLYLLTGANMTGKSTFIRTVGVSMILGYLGLPLPADALSLPLLRIFTSIRVTDSVQEDVSYFKAELQRIRLLFDTVLEGNGEYLVLIDEPLRGTNSGDKQEGTEAIIRRLLREGVIGIVATHDTGLCRLEDQTGAGIRNFHFESLIENGTLRFDFRLKRGCSQSANASLLMRQMGIIG